MKINLTVYREITGIFKKKTEYYLWYDGKDEEISSLFWHCVATTQKWHSDINNPKERMEFILRNHGITEITYTNNF